MTREYRNFDIVLEADGPDYRAIFRSLEGQPSVTLGFPLEEHDLDAFLALFGRHQRRRLEAPELTRATSVGRRLFDALFDDELRGRFVDAVNDAKLDRKGLRIRLDLSHAEDLITLPWEYLYRSEGDDFVALSNYTPVVRYLAVGEPLPPAPLDGPLRVLVMISDPVERRGTLDVEREWTHLHDALAKEVAAGQAVLTRLEDGRLESLQTELQRNDHHVFHFIGHGEFSEQHDDGVLVMEDDRGRETHVPGHLLGDYLRDCLSMRLVVLNNCEGGATSESDPFAGSAQSLLRKGLPAVVAMQFEITDQAAIDFARGFYVGLMNGFPVEGALAEARKTIRRGPTRVEFGSPVLYMSAADGAVFDVAEVDELPPEDPPPDIIPVPVSRGAPADLEPDVPVEEEPASRQGERRDAGGPPIEESVRSDPTLEIRRSRTQPADTERDRTAPHPTGEETTTPRRSPDTESRSVPPRERSGPGREEPPPWWRSGWGVAAGVIVALAVSTSLIRPLIGAPEDQPTEEPTTGGTASPTAEPGTTGVTELAGAETIADRLDEPPTIDGSDADWTSRFEFSSQELVYDPGGSWTGPDDASSTWRFAWDDRFLYVFASVTDDERSQTRTGPLLYRGDAIGMYVDPDTSNDRPGQRMTGEQVSVFIAPTGDWVRLVPEPGGAFFGSDGALTSDEGLEAAVVDTSGGYDIEARIPWRLLGVPDPRPGTTLRMTRDVSDSDVASGASEQQAMVSNSPGRTAEAQAFPEVWATLVLDASVPTEPPLGLLPDVHGLPERDAIALLALGGLEARPEPVCDASVDDFEVVEVRLPGGEVVITTGSSRAGESRFWEPGTEAEVAVATPDAC